MRQACTTCWAYLVPLNRRFELVFGTTSTSTIYLAIRAVSGKTELSAYPATTLLCFNFSILFLCGCSADVAERYERFEVTGIVRLDGTPLAAGNIVFYPETPGPVASGTEVREGKFIIPVEQGLPAGRYKIAITATSSTAPPSATEEELFENPPDVISLIPKQYNTETILSSEVHPTVENFFIYDLWTKNP